MKLKIISAIIILFNCFVAFCGFCYTNKENHQLTTLSFDTLIAFPDKVFNMENKYHLTYDENKITYHEFHKIIFELYKNNYILVNLTDYIENKPLPQNKKPLLLTFNNVTYLSNYQNQGEIDKIIIDRNNQIATYTTKKSIQDRIQYDNEFIVILEEFIKNHPNFSYNNARGIIFLSGENGILGYNTSHKNASSRYERKRVTEIVYKLKSLGWIFGSHNYKYIDENIKSDIEFAKDLSLWNKEIKSILGETPLYAYPHGVEIEDNTKKDLLMSNGFKIFFHNSNTSKIDKYGDIYKITRLHISGKTLRNNIQSFKNLFDCDYIYDHKNRLIKLK